jgi:hypothetical protein
MKISTNNPDTHSNCDGEERRAEADRGGAPNEQDAASDVYPATELDLGAMPSNTAPYNHKSQPLTILRFGVDSLYLSFKGKLKEEWLELLDTTKTRAQALDEWEQSTAQVIIGNHLFNLKDKGHGFFAYQLTNPNYNIRIAKPSERFAHMASIQLLSSAITMRGVNPLIDQIVEILSTIGTDVSTPTISRIDLFADITNTESPQHISSNQFVSRARRLNSYFENGKVSGWVVGQGGAISFRLYDKTLEIQHSGKDYLVPIWAEAGWDRYAPVWRAEFQLKRPVLKQVTSEDGETPSLGSLWQYATYEWLRLVSPNTNDNNRERWPTLPFWEGLQSIDWVKPTTPLNRQTPNLLPPGDDRLFVHGLGPITSYMAKNNIDSVEAALPQFLDDARRYHELIGKDTLEGYINRKVRLKNRQYCTVLNDYDEQDDR